MNTKIKAYDTCKRCYWGFYDEQGRCSFCDGTSDDTLKNWRKAHFVHGGIQTITSWTNYNTVKPIVKVKHENHL